MALSRRDFLRVGLRGAGVLAGAGVLRPARAAPRLAAMASTRPKGQYNVLFIGVDDLRPVLGCYGCPAVRTPNLDRLAESGTVFTRAYCQLPSCLPSRTSLLTGLRIETTGVSSNRGAHFRRHLPKHVTLPQHFKNHGYWCMAFGKVFHRQDPPSWSAAKWLPKGNPCYPIYGKADTLARQREVKAAKKPRDWWGYQEGRNTRWAKCLSWEDPDVADGALFDGQLADEVVRVLRRVKGRRFFLAPGFFRPHLPFVAPKRYYDLYPPDRIELPAHRSLPKGAPPFCHYDSAEARSYLDVPSKGPLGEAKQRELLRGYYACVSYVDAQIGRVLDELDRLHLADSTVVVVWGDHGYHFGEHGTWNKLTNFEEATRSTLIVRVPARGRRGAKAGGLVEFVDIYPTVCELCGLEVPAGLEGVSFASLLSDPSRRWKRAAFSQASPRGRQGRSMRTDRYRYVEWRKGGRVVAVELYDYQSDPHGTVNVADTEANRDLVAKLAQQLRAGWRKALPSRSD